MNEPRRRPNRPGKPRRRPDARSRPADDDEWLELETDDDEEEWLVLDVDEEQPRRKRRPRARRSESRARRPEPRDVERQPPRPPRKPRGLPPKQSRGGGGATDEAVEARGTRRTAKPVGGRVLSPKLGKPLGLVTAGGGAVAVIWYLFGWLIDFDKLTALSARIVAYMIIYGLVALYGLLATAYVMVRWRRLVIGKDRLQLLSPSGRVIGQLPYDNISLLETGQHLILDPRKVDLCIGSRKRADTWWPRYNHLDDDYDITIKGNFEVDATHLRILLKDAMDKYGA